MNEEQLSKIAGETYEEFINNDFIVGFEGLLKSKGFGSKLRIRIRNFIYDKYGKDNLIKLYRSRLSRMSHKERSKESYYISPERRRKMVDGIKRNWENNEEAKERSRQNMIKYCSPFSHTKEANDKRVMSRSWYKHSNETIEKIRISQKGKPLSIAHCKALCVPKSRAGRLGIKQSDATKQKLSQITSMQWKNGVHTPTYQSKGQLEVSKLARDLGFSVKEEFLIDGNPYDVCVPDKNLIIEFNGTFWHRDPRFYKTPDDICKNIWKKDEKKLIKAENRGYVVKVIWQYDWEKCKDKLSFIKEIINGNQ